MGAGRRMKRKQGPPERHNQGRFNAPKSERNANVAEKHRGKKRPAPEAAAPAVNKRRANGKRVAMQDAFMSGARGVRPVEEADSAQELKAEVLGGSKSKEDVSDDDKADLLDAFQEAESEEELDMAGTGLDDIDSGADESEEADELEGGVTLEDGDEFLGSGSSGFDSNEEVGREAVFSEDEDESDAEKKLTAANIEGLSQKLDLKQRAEAEQAQLELEEAALQTNLAEDRPKVLESDEEDNATKTTLTLAPDLQLLRTRITETIRVLDSFSSLSSPEHSRSEYRAQLLKDVCSYYGYTPFLAEKLLNLFSPKEAFSFFEANESPRPVVIRTNTLKTHRRELAQALIGRGVTLEPVGKWSKLGLQIFESPVPLGATPEYLAGHYIIQAASSFLPVMALAPQEHERILDMASAPGGKVTHIASLMKNTGVIFANDSNKTRAKALIGNIHRLGVKNSIVCNYDAREFPKVMGGFDRCLIDAPCTGTGVIAKDPTVKTNKTPRDFLALPHLQKQLLLCAIDSVDHTSSTSRGVVVYSTCSVTVEENEMVVQYALRKRPNMKIVDTGLGNFGLPAFTSFMGKKFNPEMRLARRYYPHTYNVDGFFVCKLQKTGPTPKDAAGKAGAGVNGGQAADADDQDIEMGETGDIGNGMRNGAAKDDFGGWDNEEDNVYLERAERRQLRKKGKNFKADKSKANKRNGENGTSSRASNRTTNK